MDDVRAWIVERIPLNDDLDRPALTALATELGRERSLWESLVRHDPGQRVFVELYRDVHLDVWLICWQSQQDTGVHDHDLSSGAVYVADGELVEDRLVAGGGGIREESVPRPAGTVFDFDAARVHCMRHPGGAPAVSIHLYSPALWRMGYYSFDDDGNLCRTSVTYADEMWERPSGLAGLRV
jgi:Cysteine dioxygenase type I